MKKNALITGANKGIGFEIARQLGQQGFHIFLSARNNKRGEMAHQKLVAEGIEATFIQMDVGEESSIEQALQKVQSHTTHLDVLINNAGILIDEGRSIFDIPTSEIRDTININAIGVLLVTRTFAPLLGKGSREVNMSSGAGAICEGMNNWAPVYSISKTAENAVTVQLAYALKNKGIPVNAVCPGWVRTDMGGQGASRSVAKGAETPVWLATEADGDLTGRFFRDKEVISW